MIWERPHWVYRLAGCPANVEYLEWHVPGVLVYGYVQPRSGRRYRMRVEKMRPDQRELCAETEIICPVHAAELLDQYVGEDVLRQAKHSPMDVVPIKEEASAAYIGRGLVSSMADAGLVKPHVPGMLTDYQAANVGWVQHRPYLLDVFPCGAGKTLSSMLCALSKARPGGVLVVCPAKARHVWWSQVQEYTNVEPHRMLPEGAQRKDYESLAAYLQRQQQVGMPPFVVVGLEALNLYVPKLHEAGFAPSVVIYDEIHEFGNMRRWAAVVQKSGDVGFERKKTKNGNEVRALAAYDVSRMKSLNLRIGLTATPLDDGRPRRLWSPLDLLDPGGWAFSYRKFASRYTAAYKGDYGLVDKGSSNLDELRSRANYLMHEVTHEESHGQLPPTRVQVIYLPKDQLNRAERFSDDQTFGAATRAAAKAAARGGRYDKEQSVEIRLMEACSRKRRYVLDEVKQGLRGKGKVALFTGRRVEAEVWATKLKKELSQGDLQMAAPQIWVAHGGVPEAERDAMIDAYAQHPGPCCLIATGQSVGTSKDGMQTTSLAIFAMLPWRPGDFEQWKGRFDRLGGSATLLKVVVAEGTYDETIVQVLVEKFGTVDAFLESAHLTGLDEKLLGLEDEDALLDSIMDKLTA